MRECEIQTENCRSKRLTWKPTLAVENVENSPLTSNRKRQTVVCGKLKNPTNVNLKVPNDPTVGTNHISLIPQCSEKESSILQSQLHLIIELYLCAVEIRSEMTSQRVKNKKVQHETKSSGVTVVLYTLWRLLWSIAVHTHGKMLSICFIQ